MQVKPMPLLPLALSILLIAASGAAGQSSQKSTQDSAAQDMPDGRWRGWLQQPDQDSIRVSYAVQHYHHHILITMEGRSGVVYDMSDVKVKNDVLTFDWGMGLGTFLYCRLSRRDGRSFEGTCHDRAPGQSGKPVDLWMQMSPPASDSTHQ